MVPLCACNGIAYVYVVSKQAPSRGSGDRLAFLGVLGAFSKDMAHVAFVLVACAAVDLAGAVRDMAVQVHRRGLIAGTAVVL